MIKVSIIVPIYNAGFRLHKCLSTLVNQTLRDIEIICVLDAPTDGSEKVVEEFAAYDQRIKIVYNKTNLHVAESRNRGMDLAKGEYIGFSDHDDSRELEMYEKLYNQASLNSSDIVYSNSYIKTDEVIDSSKYCDSTRNGVIKSIILPMEHSENKNFLSKSVWSSIYGKDFLLKNTIRFLDRKAFYEEDTLFNLKAFLSTSKISFVDDFFYTWNKFENTESSQIIDKIEIKQIKYIQSIIGLLEDYNELKAYRNEVIILISDLLRTYYYKYKALPPTNKKNLASLLKRVSFPLFGKYQNLKLVGGKRIKLLLFVFELKYL